MKNIKWSTLAGTLMVLGCLALYGKQIDAAEVNASKTVMVYMVGSNLESESAAASMDIIEMADSGFDTSEINLLIYTGGTLQWHVDIPSEHNTIQRIVAQDGDYNLECVKEYEDAYNTGDPETLAEFVNFCTENYPAEDYSLIFWDHGSGPMQGFGYDEMHGGDQLSLAEMKLAMDQTMFVGGQKLEFIGFDACLMASIEIADIWSLYADYMIASQEVEPGYGWNYSFLATYDKDSNVTVTAQNIIDQYVDFYYSNDMYPELTLSCMDLRLSDAVMQKVDNVFGIMDVALEEGNYPILVRAREDVKNFGVTTSGGAASSPDLIDLNSLADSMAEQYPSEMQELKNLLEEMVVYRSTEVWNANGISVYYPYNNLDYYENYASNSMYIAGSTSQYSHYIQKFMEYRQFGSGDAEWLSASEKLSDYDFQMKLSEEQLNEFASASYTVFLKPEADVIDEEDAGTYRIVVRDQTIKPDQNGVLSVKQDQSYYVMTNSAGEESIISVRQMEQERRKKIFRTEASVSVGTAYNWDMTSERRYINFSTTYAGDDPSIQRIYVPETFEGDGIYGNRTEADLEGWNNLRVVYQLLEPVNDGEGHIRPYQNWSYGGNNYISSIALDENFQIEKRDCKDASVGQFYGQIVITDIYGDQYASNLFPFASEEIQSGYAVVKTETENGTLIWNVYEDHAELVNYTGTDNSLEIPESISDVPVTKILEGAFGSFDAENLTHLTLPHTIQYIAQDACWCGLEELTLPSSIEYVAEGAFLSRTLQRIRLIDENGEEIEEGTNYRLINGALYNKEGNRLIRWPSVSAEKVCTIPEGTTEIGAFAFYNADIENVQFNENLKIIDNMAFYNCENLKDLSFPDSLEYIGHGAFGVYFDRQEFEVISLGKNLSFIGKEVFENNYFKGIVVSEDNEIFSSENGFLLSKDKKTLYECPLGTEGVLSIPEGVTVIDAVINVNDDVTELKLPDSLTYIGLNAFIAALNVDTLHIGKGLRNFPAGKFMIAGFDRENVTISEENPYLKKEGEFILSQDETEIYAWLKSDAQQTVLEIPEGVTELANEFAGVTEIKTLKLPSSVEDISLEFFDQYEWTSLEEIIVSEENELYRSESGMLLSKDGIKLYCCPAAIEEVIVPDGVQVIGQNAFYKAVLHKSIRFPESAKILQGGNFCYETNYGSEDEDTLVIDIYMPKTMDEISEYAFVSNHDFDYNIIRY